MSVLFYFLFFPHLLIKVALSKAKEAPVIREKKRTVLPLSISLRHLFPFSGFLGVHSENAGASTSSYHFIHLSQASFAFCGGPISDVKSTFFPRELMHL